MGSDESQSVASASVEPIEPHTAPGASPGPGAPSGQPMVSMMMATQSPLPPPEWMREYEKVVPGLSERLLAQFIGESDHRHKVEMEELRLTERLMASNERGASQGRLYALIFCLCVLAVAGYALHQGAAWAATILGGSTLTATATAFIVGRTSESGRLKKSDRDQKERALTPP